MNLELRISFESIKIMSTYLLVPANIIFRDEIRLLGL